MKPGRRERGKPEGKSQGKQPFSTDVQTDDRTDDQNLSHIQETGRDLITILP